MPIALRLITTVRTPAATSGLPWRSSSWRPTRERNGRLNTVWDFMTSIGTYVMRKQRDVTCLKHKLYTVRGR
jgi:hypothetical protein